MAIISSISCLSAAKRAPATRCFSASSEKRRNVCKLARTAARTLSSPTRIWSQGTLVRLGRLLYGREYTGANYGAKNDNRQSEPQVTMTKHPSGLIVTELHLVYSEAPMQDQFSRLHYGRISRVDSIPNPLQM